MRPVIFLAVAIGVGSAVFAPEASHAQPGDKAVQCLAEAVYFEARGTGPKSRAAVAHVVLNRVDDSEFPDTACGVVQDRCQFSYQCDGKPERLTEEEARENAFATARAVYEGDMPDPTDGALFFHSVRLNPGWFATLERTTTLGGHIFYR